MYLIKYTSKINFTLLIFTAHTEKNLITFGLHYLSTGQHCVTLSDYSFENGNSLDSSVRFKGLTLRIHKSQYIFPTW